MTTCGTLPYKFQLTYRYPELLSLSPPLNESSVVYLDSSGLYLGFPLPCYMVQKLPPSRKLGKL